MSLNAVNSNDSFRLLFEAVPDAILIVDKEGHILLNNAMAEDLLEAPPNGLLGISVESLVPPASRRKHPGLRHSFHQSARSRPMDVTAPLKALKLNGREFSVEISLAPAPASFGDAVIVVMRDITERLIARRTARDLIRASAVARISELSLRERLFEEVVPQIVALSCPPLSAELVAYFNLLPAENNLYCTNAAGSLSKNILHTKISNLDATLAQQVINSGAPWLIGDTATSQIKLCPPLQNSELRCLIAAPIGEREHPRALLIVGSRAAHFFSHEDTAFVEAIANIISSALQRSLTEEQLLLSQRLESLGRLTGGVAHDFNNLLTIISGNMQLIQAQAATDPALSRAVEAALRASKRGAELTNTLLSFSRRQTLKPSKVALPKLLGSFQDLLGRTLGSSIEINVHFEPSLPSIIADSGQLETALLNLAVNARDAMTSHGRLSIKASLVRSHPPKLPKLPIAELPEGCYVRISVADTGSGMSTETLSRAFEPFFTTKPSGKGSGLGLSMVYGFIKQSAGHINVQSALGVGTEISLFLPAAKDDAQLSCPSAQTSNTTNSTEALSVAAASTASTGSTPSILILEDDAEVRHVAEKFLTSLGHPVFTAKNRRQAAAQLKAHPAIELLFSDVILTGRETGPKVMAALRKIKPSLRVLYTSGYAKNAFPEGAAPPGERFVLSKPYTLEALSQAVQQALSNQSN